MRLKEALKHQQADSDGRVIENEREGHLEYFFGIREPNSRIGKQGSRLPLPPTPHQYLFCQNLQQAIFPDEEVLRQLTSSQADPPAVKIHARCT
jgi:hypothetical protein